MSPSSSILPSILCCQSLLGKRWNGVYALMSWQDTRVQRDFPVRRAFHNILRSVDSHSSTFQSSCVGMLKRSSFQWPLGTIVHCWNVKNRLKMAIYMNVWAIYYTKTGTDTQKNKNTQTCIFYVFLLSLYLELLYFYGKKIGNSVFISKWLL